GLEFSSMLSFAVPGTVMGIGYILAFNQGPLLLTGTSLIIILAFVFRNMPVGIRSGVAAIHQIDRSLEEASTMLRANSAVTLWRIVMPLVRSALLSGLVFAFVRAMTAVSQVIFLITPQHSLATTQILTYIEYGSQGRGAALASLLTVFMIAVILVLYGINRRLGGPTAREVTAA
ncbi:MAG TPA: ABC transporter permease subunit, partial [bacterium]|nr:ABC transporter permease subunit [bacterium]